MVVYHTHSNSSQAATHRRCDGRPAIDIYDLLARLRTVPTPDEADLIVICADSVNGYTDYPALPPHKAVS